MFDLDGLIDQAKEEQGLKSDRDLDRHLNHKGLNISQWRTGRSLPSDDSLTKLCEAAGFDADQIMRELIQLAIHRTAATDQVKANPYYVKILKNLSDSLKTFVVCGLVGLTLMNLNDNSAFASAPLLEQATSEQFILWEII